MKIMVLSDIHGKAPALKQALDIYDREGFERLFILGDILYHGPRNPLPEGYDPKEVVTLLNPLKSRILAIRGNCDSEVDQMILEFPTMGDYALYQTDTVRFVLTHGHLDEARLPVCEAGRCQAFGAYSYSRSGEPEKGSGILIPAQLPFQKEDFLPLSA